jgi:peptide/nickel transport system permease protein
LCHLLNNLSKLIIPAIVIALRYIAITQRMTRSAILEILREDYVLNARAYGLNEFSIINSNVLRNSSRPIITVLGNEFAFLIGGLVITEQVFNLNGIGALPLQSIENADYIVTQNLVMLLALIFATINIIIDLTYAYLDPRVRFN